MVKLIASDIDGTLIQDSTPDLYPEMVQTIRELHERGIQFCAASGRQYGSLSNVFREVACEIAFITENGALVRYRGENISVTPMKREYAEELMGMLRPYYGECETILSTSTGSYVESKSQDFVDLLTYGYHNTFHRVKDVLDTREDIIKICVYRKNSIRSLGESCFIPAWEGRLNACIAGEEWVDFMDASVDKGNALKFLMDYFHVAPSETMAFGDSNNDIGMIRAAGIGYAVDSAAPEVKQEADHICPDWRKKGVWKVIRKEIFDQPITGT